MALVSGAPSIRLEGDEKRALALIPEGRLLLAKAQAFAQRADIPTYSMNRRVSEDEYIYVLVAAGQNIVQISAGVVIPDRVLEEPEIPEPSLFPDFLSGMVTDGIMEEREETKPDGTKIRYKIIRSWAPTPNCASVQDISAGLQSSRRLAVAPYASFGEWREPEGSRVQYSQLQVPRSSQWSGTMKKVVQICMGFGRINKNKLRDPAQPNKATPYMKEVDQYGVQVRFDYKFMRSHGIFRAEDGRLWLVEISAGRGVVAMPLPIYPGSMSQGFRARAEARGDTAMTTALDELGCLPTGEAFPTTPALFNKKVENGEILQLLSASDLSDFYGRLSGFSSICGWSFSDRGEQAHNVGYHYPEEEDGYQRACWYQINIKIGPINKNREPGEPIASGSAELRLQQEGYLYSPPIRKSFIPVKYYEPMMEPPGLLSHSARPLYGGSLQKDCDTPVYVGIVEGELKVARYFRAGDSKPINTRIDERDGEPCLYGGTWSWTYESGNQSMPPMPYTNDIDSRAVLSSSVTTGTLTVSPSGFGAATGVVFIDRPQYVLVRRARVFKSHTVTETKSGEMRSACFVNPGYLRDGYYFFDGHYFESHKGSESVDYRRTLMDPNQGVSWSMISGGLPGGPPYGPQCSGENCGGKHTYPLIMCNVYNTGDCSEYADAGQWLYQCQASYAFRGSGIRGPEWSTSWDNGRDFQGTWNLVAAAGGMRSGPTNEILHEYAMQPSPDPDTGSVQQLFAMKNAIGSDTLMYTKGFVAGLVVEGYTPVPAQNMSTFIGVNQP
jgi:hypothetical protein